MNALDLYQIDDARLFDRRMNAWWIHAESRLFLVARESGARYEIFDNAAGLWRYLCWHALDMREVIPYETNEGSLC